jgi:heat shock protein 1/8
LDVSVLTIEEGVFKVVASAGDEHLGGDDFVNRMVDYVVIDFLKRHYFHVSSDPVCLGRLRTACERAKRTLSTCSATIEVDWHDGIEYKSTITRSGFEGLCLDYFEKCMELWAKSTKSSWWVVLPEYPRFSPAFPTFSRERKCANRSIPRKAVAYGATLQAARLSGKDKSEQPPELQLSNITPLSFGVETAGGIMTRLIERETCVPVKETLTFSTNADKNQTSVMLQVFDGERIVSKDNIMLLQD